ncbi:helix-turn-helix domain-containing protein [Enterococcus sp. JM9B]|uniref:helix-turn-helix domain-containing protein n=1 Tax=Enterococcus sp. JM9B TaxID=1857216 RepID=UPI003075E52A
MLYEELIMDSTTLLKYQLYKKLMSVGQTSYPVSQIATEMNLNYQQTVIDLTEIDAELSELDPHYQSIFVGAGKVNCLNLSFTIDKYRYHLLKSSIPFQFVLYFLNEENPSIDDFCVRYHSSRSTVSRKIDKLKRHLKKFNIRFTYTEASMVGDERLVRLALFNIVWLGARGLDWPFAISEKKPMPWSKISAIIFLCHVRTWDNWNCAILPQSSFLESKKNILLSMTKPIIF